MSDHYSERRHERRERRLKSKRERMQKHGAGLRQNFAGSALSVARRLVRHSTRQR